MPINHICCIFNYGSHYRKSIYQLMDQELKCDFFFGDNLPGNIKKMDYHSLKGYKKSLRNIWLFNNFYWQKNSVNLVFKPYKHYLIDGEPYCISSWIILILAKMLGKKTYCWTHGWYGKEGNLKRNLKKIFFGLAHHIFLYGDYAKSLMLKEGFKASKLSCIYNSLDYELQLSLRKVMVPGEIYKKYFKNNNPVLIFTGRLTPEKKLSMLLDALARLNSMSYPVNLILVGSGEMTDSLKELGKSLQIDKQVWFYGACYDEKELSELIYNADLCVSPGNVGLTAIHAMTYGTPVLTHNNYPFQGPEFEAIEESKTGTFFDHDNLESLVVQIQFWFSLPLNREQIRSNCFKVIDTKYNPFYQINVLKEQLISPIK